MGGDEPPKTSAPATETSADVQQEAEATKKKASKQSGLTSTALTEQVNPAGGNTVLG